MGPCRRPCPAGHTRAADHPSRPTAVPVPTPAAAPRPAPSHGSPPAPGSGAQQGWAQPWGHFGLGTVLMAVVPSGAPPAGWTLARWLSGGLGGHAGSLGLLPAPLLVGGLWMPAWLTQSLALGEAFVSAALGCGVSLRRRRDLAGAGAAPSPQPGGPPEPALCPRSPAHPRRMTACPSGAGRPPVPPTAPPRTPSPSAPR